jgi:hypothetical protein
MADYRDRNENTNRLLAMLVLGFILLLLLRVFVFFG